METKSQATAGTFVMQFEILGFHFADHLEVQEAGNWLGYLFFFEYFLFQCCKQRIRLVGIALLSLGLGLGVVGATGANATHNPAQADTESTLLLGFGARHYQHVSACDLARSVGLGTLSVPSGNQQEIVQAHFDGLVADGTNSNPDQYDVAAKVRTKLLLDLVFIERDGG